MSKEKYEISKRLHDAVGGLNYHLEVFGDVLAKRERYKGIDGMEAIHFYLIHKFGWLPNDVISMHPDQIRLVLSQELQGFVLPAEARL